MNHITVILLTATLAAGAQVAHAATSTNDSARRIDVHFADVNLGSIEGASVLYRRLQNAATSVCDEGNPKDPGSAARVKACIAKAISAAVAQINRPALTAYHRAKLGPANVVLLEASR